LIRDISVYTEFDARAGDVSVLGCFGHVRNIFAISEEKIIDDKRGASEKQDGIIPKKE
jgi:hypothetical protein